ncbi:methyl-accepting chemotaxis protein [Roseisalinus antarcticus]|uniref:Methyl-accepting chemotaxis protein II n=1 Tax=Roseisalinus antarcticus TaxID=254357 RepID=A0A1Y5U4E8_9RHOB|nr:methyl-accepting chemotaxis protein [Roseisalinus antarcticus]SLN77981.1 Methyl-accepting chemotaxis protein II [Roseisalinus antarcticus]
MKISGIGTAIGSAASSLFVRCAALTAAITIIVAALLFVFYERHADNIARLGLERLALEMTSGTALNLGGAIRFAKVDQVDETLTSYTERADHSMLFAAVHDAEGNLVSRFGGTREGEIDDLSTLADAARATGSVQTTGDGFWISVPVRFGSDNGVVGSLSAIWSPEADLAEFRADRRTQQGVVVGMFLVLLGLSLLILRQMLAVPLKKVGAGMIQVAEGQYDDEIPLVRRRDEIGGIARSLDTLRAKLIEARAAEIRQQEAQATQERVVDRLRRGLGALADGDLTHRIRTAFASDYEELRTDFNRASQTLNDTVTNVHASASNIRAGAEDISRASDDLSRRTENQAATLEETAAATDELTQSVKSAADGAREVEGIVTDAKTHAEQSGAVVQSAVSAMTEIEKSSEQISQIIGVIDDIAFQTNLLALNAGVEAARAGEAGKGFAVVASEVRALAQRSSDAAKEIKSLISGSSLQVEEGVTLVGKAGEALSSIVERVSHISELVTNIARGTVEQATGLGEINLGVTNLDQVTQQNAAMVEQSTAAAHALRTDAIRLTDLVEHFKIAADSQDQTRAAA